jgi:transposase InsO family protein
MILMPWEERTVEKSRKEFVKEVMASEISKSKLCAKYGISRVTGDKWLKRYANGESLSNQSRAPFHIPNKTNAAVERKIIKVRLEHPAWGPRKIVKYLENAGEAGLPAPSTVCSILQRNGLVSKEASQAAKPYKRFEREHPNELWQTDFKGHFQMLNHLRCHPLTILDDHSRFSLCVDAKLNERLEGVVESFSRVFQEYGKPETLLCDNGNPWGTSQTTGYTRFEIWMMQHNVLPIHGRPGHPQTQGKEERFHRTLKDEVLKQTSIKDISHAQEAFDEFRDCYNHIRPHGALALKTPAARYKPSANRMENASSQWEYPQGYKTRKIKDTGFITFGSQGYFLSEAFGGLILAIRESSLNDCVNIYYRNFRVGRINVDERVFVSRKIYRLDNDD